MVRIQFILTIPAEVGIFNAIDKSLTWRVGDNGKVNLEFLKMTHCTEKPMPKICGTGVT